MRRLQDSGAVVDTCGEDQRRVDSTYSSTSVLFGESENLYLLKSRQILLQSLQTSRVCAMRVRTCWYCEKFEPKIDKVWAEVIIIPELVVKATFSKA